MWDNVLKCWYNKIWWDFHVQLFNNIPNSEKLSEAARFPFVFFESASLSLLLKGQCHEIFNFWFFHESVSPKHVSIPLRRFRFFSKIRGNIRGSRCQPVSLTPVAITVQALWMVNAAKFTLRTLLALLRPGFLCFLGKILNLAYLACLFYFA